MTNTTKIEMSEDEHGLIGCGQINFIYPGKSSGIGGYYEFVDKSYKIVFSHEETMRIFKKLVMEDKIVINNIFRIATDSCGIPLFRLKEKTRDKEVVFARYLVFWYVKKYLKYTLKGAGNLFEMDHTTALHGIRTIDDDPKYLDRERQKWRKVFMDKLKDKELI